MNNKLYSGEINWERIYRIFHAPSHIADRIIKELGNEKSPIIYSGFLETASHLAKTMNVTFVDNSEFIISTAKKRYQNIQHTCTGDITEIIHYLPITSIIIACRISAYWDLPDYFTRLANSIVAYPRDTVLIDFYDRDMITPGMQFTFSNGIELGHWDILTINEMGTENPPIYTPRLNVSYTLTDQEITYEGIRAFFRKKDILAWALSEFPDYTAAIKSPLLENDPSFLLKLTKK